VSAREIAGINVGQKATIKPDAYPDETFSGTVVNISPIIDRSSQTSDVEIEAPNPSYKLKPGMFTRVELTVSVHKSVPVIPADVLLKEGEDTFAYVESGGKAFKRKVVTGISDGIKTEVLSGLKAGEQLIVAGYYSLRDGMSVTSPDKNKGAGEQMEGGKRPTSPGREGGRENRKETGGH